MRAAVTDLVSRQADLLSTLCALEADRGTDHDAFLSSATFQSALQEVQCCQQAQKELLRFGGVQNLCPNEYPEMLRLSVELMTAFSRVVAQPDTVDVPRSITENGLLRERSVSASL